MLAALLAVGALLVRLPLEGETAPPPPALATVLLVLCLGVSVAAYFTRLRDWVGGGWTDRALTPYRLLLYCLVSGWILVLVVAPPLDPGTLAAWAAYSLSGFSALTLAGRATGPRARRRLRGLDLLLFQIVFLLLAAEIGLRGMARLRPSVLFMSGTDDAATRVAQSRYAPGTVRFGFAVNRQGHYDSELVPRGADRPVVLSIGDSFSAGVVPHPYHFTTVAERVLSGVEIYNMGVPSIGPPEYLHLLLSEGLGLKPDVILVNLCLGNDLTYRLPEPGESRRLASWLDRDHLLLYQVPRRLALLARLDREHREGLTETRGDAEAVIVDSVDEIRERFPWVDDPALERPRLDRKTYLEVVAHRMNLLRRQRREEYHRRLQPLLEMRRAASGTPILVLLIPDEFQVNGRLWALIRRDGASRADRMRSIWITEAWLEENGFPSLNLVPVLRGVGHLEDGQRHLYHRQGTHFNARGNQVAGRALAELLRPWVATASSERAPAPR